MDSYDEYAPPAVFSGSGTGVAPSSAGQVSELKKTQEARPVLNQQIEGDQASDSASTAINASMVTNPDGSIFMGRVLLAIPYIHCYKVQTGGREGTCVATAVSQHSHMPTGVRRGEVIPVNSTVLVFRPKTSKMSYIIGVVPSLTMSDEFNASDHVQAGGNSGPKKVPAYANIAKSSTDAMGWVPQSSGRPMDGLNGEYVRMSETGIGLLIDSFQTYLRVNELCGLWLNYFDSYTKLAGSTLDIQSYCQQDSQAYDEGELGRIRGQVIYPWEAVGAYASGESGVQDNDQSSVQLDKSFPFAGTDLKDQAQMPIYRMTSYGGYLGQGETTIVTKPAKESGVRLATDEDEDTGLFQESTAIDGSYSVRSAKQITISKYPLIPSPRRKRKMLDPKGDSLEGENAYKFSGKFGDGQDHKVNDWNKDSVSDLKSLVTAAGVQDLMARAFNWQSTHPFYYHQGDYNYPEEGEGSSLNSVQFMRGTYAEAYVDAPDPVKLKIDERYGEVSYYPTQSYFHMGEDGSVVIGDGYGSQITMAGGQIRLEAGGDVMLMSGARVVTLGKEAIVRAQGSVDISSSDKDVRLKAENNLQMLGGNSGGGGVLIESKAQGVTQQYEQKSGEDVRGTGIVLLAKSGEISSVSQNVYIRSGVGANSAEGSGSITLDCANGRGTMASYARAHAFYNSAGLSISHSPTGQDSPTLEDLHYFGPNLSSINGPLIISGHTVICDGGSLGVDRDILANRNIQAVGQMACLEAKVGDSSTKKIPEAIKKFIADFCLAAEKLPDSSQKIFTASFAEGSWSEGRTGNTALLDNQLGFSYRDEPAEGSNAYGYDKFQLLETRWQQLDRMGLASSTGSTWEEKPVQYQGSELYPWPGRANWVENDTLRQYSDTGDFLLFDSSGKAKSRADNQSDYESPQLKDWGKKVPNTDYKL